MNPMDKKIYQPLAITTGDNNVTIGYNDTGDEVIMFISLVKDTEIAGVIHNAGSTLEAKIIRDKAWIEFGHGSWFCLQKGEWRR